MNVLGQSIVVIDKYETAVEILDKRSGIYSSRFVFNMPYSFEKLAVKANIWSRPVSPLFELMPGWGSGLIFLRYGNVPTVIMLISWLIKPSFLGDRWYGAILLS
jgi:hypothetical protein